MTLSEKEYKMFNENGFKTKDVKEAIKELKEEQKKLLKAYDEHRIDFVSFCVKMIDLPNKIFGEELCSEKGVEE